MIFNFLHLAQLRTAQCPNKIFPNKITALKVCCGTAEEQHIFIDHFKVDSVGWERHFLLVPEGHYSRSSAPSDKNWVQRKKKNLYLKWKYFLPWKCPQHLEKDT